MIEKITLYFITVFIYITWLVYAVKTNKLLKFPIISTVFMGLFIFNALGSILIIFPDSMARNDYFSYDYILMLNVQAIIFYALTSIYFYFFGGNKPIKPTQAKKVDKFFLYILFIFLLLLLLFFFYKVGIPPLLKILSGKFGSRNEIIDYRTETIYSVNATLASLVFDIIPMLVGTYAFLNIFIQKKRLYYNYLITGLCVLIAALPGGKGSILRIAIALFFAYLLIQSESSNAPRKVIFPKRALLGLSTAFIPVLSLFNVYYGSDFSVFEQLKLLIYRIIGVYSESLAATVTYTEKYGFLNGRTLPNIKGILNHNPIQIGKEMHIFLFNSTRGNAPISTLAEGYINFGWPGFVLFAIVTFIIVITIQEIFRSMPRNLFTLSLIVVYSMLATRVAQTGLFATLLSLTYTMLFAFLFLTRAILVTFIRQKQWVVNLSKTSKIIN
jgi:oligosaccharide repeat unit polymerase